MERLSLRLPRWTLMPAVVLFLACEAAALYLFALNRRVSRELVNHSWREPTVILTAAGGRTREVAHVWGVDWRTTPPVLIDSLPKHVADAFLAAEDVRFRRHIGVDPIGIGRALVRNVRARGIAQGGSTIDQQIIKQRYLTNERTWRRKFVEMILAVVLDARLTKDEILELYLNDVYLGHHEGVPVLGIDEASRLYFDKLPTELRVDEAAVLAAIIRAPNRDNPYKRPDVVRGRRDAVLATMRDRGWLSDAEYREAVEHGVAFTSGGSLPRMPYPFYLRALRSELVREIGIEPILESGLKIVCELDPEAQRVAERVARRAPQQLESRYGWLAAQSRNEPLQVAILSVDPRSGGIRALVGGSDFRLSPFDRTSAMRRQPGSAFKTFAYLAAIASKRATPASLLLDAPLTVQTKGEAWQPQKYDEEFRGRVTLRQAFEKSLNVPTVRLTQDIGLHRVVSTAKKFGFAEDFASIPALPLGVTEVSMRELTAAYTAFPSLGTRVEPYLVAAVQDRRGETIYRHDVEEKRVVGADAAYVMHTLLRGVVQRGTARRLSRWGLGYVAGKTGTTNDYRDAWFVGYTPDMVTTVWVGYDHGAPLRLSSAEAAIPVWGAYMSAIPHVRHEPEPPKGVTFRQIDPETGMLWSEGCPGPWREVFLSGTAPTHRCPRGIFGRVVRRVFFDDEHFAEPPAITFEKFRRWANEVDRSRQEVERGLDRLRRIFD